MSFTTHNHHSHELCDERELSLHAVHAVYFEQLHAACRIFGGEKSSRRLLSDKPDSVSTSVQGQDVIGEVSWVLRCRANSVCLKTLLQY